MFDLERDGLRLRMGWPSEILILKFVTQIIPVFDWSHDSAWWHRVESTAWFSWSICTLSHLALQFFACIVSTKQLKIEQRNSQAHDFSDPLSHPEHHFIFSILTLAICLLDFSNPLWFLVVPAARVGTRACWECAREVSDYWWSLRAWRTAHRVWQTGFQPTLPSSSRWKWSGWVKQYAYRCGCVGSG